MIAAPLDPSILTLDQKTLLAMFMALDTDRYPSHLSTARQRDRNRCPVRSPHGERPRAGNAIGALVLVL
jgi:hypothetical protein